jgi:hypothetical protein
MWIAQSRLPYFYFKAWFRRLEMLLTLQLSWCTHQPAKPYVRNTPDSVLLGDFKPRSDQATQTGKH